MQGFCWLRCVVRESRFAEKPEADVAGDDCDEEKRENETLGNG
jgi:hypothetical protein